MKIYITKRSNGKYNYLANWIDSESGLPFYDWFEDLSELKEYISGWEVTMEKVNFQILARIHSD